MSDDAQTSEIETLRRELAEARRQQEAMADALEAVARSGEDRDDTLKSLLRTAARLCEADNGMIFLVEGRHLVGAMYLSGDPDEEAFVRGFTTPLSSTTSTNVLSLTMGEVIQHSDTYDGTIPNARLRDRLKFGSYVNVPMMLKGTGVGIFSLTRKRPSVFTEQQIDLVRSFAAQAAIVVRNVRQFQALEARTAELNEALEQQTATAETLKTLSRSAFDLDKVLYTLVRSAMALCGASTGTLAVRENGQFRARAVCGHSPENAENIKQRVFLPGRNHIAPRVLLSHAVEMIPDATLDPEFDYPGFVHNRSFLGVPLLNEEELLGVFVLGRPEPGGFTERQINLVKTYADQAVIAIGNVQLFKDLETRTAELNQALEQQTATAETLKTLSRSVFDLDAILNTLVESAVALFHAHSGGLVLLTDGEYRMRAHIGFGPQMQQFFRENVFKPGRGMIIGRVLLSQQVEQIIDVHTDNDLVKLGDPRQNPRSSLGVPLFRDGDLVGAMVVRRREPGGFSAREIELAQTFADQAVIAIGNAQLFKDLAARTEELRRSLAELRATQDRLIQTEKLASLGQLTAGVAHEIKNPLNFVNNFSKLSVELLEELGEALTSAALAQSVKDEVEDIARTLTENLEKIRHHGQRADSIVKNMLLHARQDGGERRAVDLNALIEESLNLAYHGARAERRDFAIALSRDLDPTVGPVSVFPQEFTRVLLNLFSNGFYAASARAGEAGFTPSLRVSTRAFEDRIEIRVRDNGTGIPDVIRGKLFTPFFTTKPAGEGTGLGLSLSYDIIVKQHGGSLTFESEPGLFTEFLITLPQGESVEREGRLSFSQ